MLAACAGDSGDRPLRVQIGVSPEGPRQDPAPTVYIDGVAATSFDRTYESNEAAIAEEHLIELRHGERTIRKRAVNIVSASCLDYVKPAASVSISFCLYDSGDIRFRAGVVQDPPCVGDGFCWSCMDRGCLAGTRCASRITSIDPPASYLACVPIGPALLGDSCTFVEDPDGAYDTCAGGLLCVGGVCRQFCDRDSECAGGTCEQLPGHAPEVQVCM